ncbi:MAG: redoxin family protein, partial [Candidatus Acidiferrales bacterium]
ATLPMLPGYGWQSNPQSLVLAIRKGCHFCEASMPFYRKLYDLEKSNALKAKMIAVLPDSATDAFEVLSTQNLPMPFISGANLSSLSVSGTPTLILVDRNGKVEKTWVGQLNSAGEESVLAATKNASQQGRENF